MSWARTSLAVTAVVAVTTIGPGVGGSSGAQMQVGTPRAAYGSSRVVGTYEYFGAPTIAPGEPFASPGKQAIVGDFTGPGTAGDLDDIIWYTPGSGGDVLWRGNGDGTWKHIQIAVNASYKPIVGQFSNDSKEDVFWYAPGSGPDYLWDFTDDGYIKHTTYDIDGAYTPVVGRFSADSGDDIIWYAPGGTADLWWDFDGSGGIAKRFLDIDGSYTPVVGAFARQPGVFDLADDIIWYAPGAAKDLLWNFKGDRGGITSSPLTINGTYKPLRIEYGTPHESADDVIWYAPGPAQDVRWRFTDTKGGHLSLFFAVDGYYTPLSGAIFGTSVDDVIWFAPGPGVDTLWVDGRQDRAMPLDLDGNLTPALGGFSYHSDFVSTERGDDIIDRHS